MPGQPSGGSSFDNTVAMNFTNQSIKMSNLPTSDPQVLGQLYNDNLVLKVSPGPPTADEIMWGNVEFSLFYNGTSWVDQSPNSHPMAATGVTTVAKSNVPQDGGYQGGTGPSYMAYFEDGDFIRCDPMLNWHDSVTKPFTIEFNVYSNSGSFDESEFFIGFNNDDGANDYLFGHRRLIMIKGTDSDYTSVYWPGQAADLGLTHVTSNPLDFQNNVDHFGHVAITYNGAGVHKVYINGTNTYTYGSSTNTNLASPLNDKVGLIGCEADASNGGNLGNFVGGLSHDCYLYNFQVLSVVKYTSNFTPPTAQFSSTSQFA